jgi:eukaryotic-like serine/threonine-protein kinase
MSGAARTCSQELPTPVPGNTLAGRYQLLREIGQGASGRVYEALDLRRGGRRIALKLLTQGDPQQIYRLKNEFRSLAELAHANLVALHALGSDGMRWFVAMDLVRGTDFLSHVRPAPRGELDAARLRAALAQLLRGVAAIHSAGKMHRDLKPSNVLVEDDGRVRIVDFGLVTPQSPGGVGRTRDGWFAGTPDYAAPEQLGGEPFDAQADLYAIGVMLYQALTGELPFTGSPERMLSDKLGREPNLLHSTGRELPDDLSTLCAGLLARDPRARPDAVAVLERLGDVCRQPACALEPARFHGRTHELARLTDALIDASGRATALLVHGAAGSGKSALVRHFAEQVRREHHAVVLAGRCDAREEVPYRALDAPMDALSRFLTALPESEAASLMPRDAALITRLFPTLARVPALRRMPLRRMQLAEEVSARAFAGAALKELLARIADRRPLLLVFDDVQWDDPESGALLSELVREPGAPAALFLCVCRSDQLAASALLRGLSGEGAPPCHVLPIVPRFTSTEA